MRTILTRTKRLATPFPLKQSLEDTVCLLLVFVGCYGDWITLQQLHLDLISVRIKTMMTPTKTRDAFPFGRHRSVCCWCLYGDWITDKKWPIKHLVTGKIAQYHVLSQESGNTGYLAG